MSPTHMDQQLHLWGARCVGLHDIVEANRSLGADDGVEKVSIDGGWAAQMRMHMKSVNLIARCRCSDHVGVGPRGQGFMRDRLLAVGGDCAWT